MGEGSCSSVIAQGGSSSSSSCSPSKSVIVRAGPSVSWLLGINNGNGYFGIYTGYWNKMKYIGIDTENSKRIGKTNVNKLGLILRNYGNIYSEIDAGILTGNLNY